MGTLRNERFAEAMPRMVVCERQHPRSTERSLRLPCLSGGTFRRGTLQPNPTLARTGSPVDTDHDQVRRVTRQNSRSFLTAWPCCRGSLPACSRVRGSRHGGEHPTPEASHRSAVAADAVRYVALVIPSPRSGKKESASAPAFKPKSPPTDFYGKRSRRWCPLMPI